MEDKKKNGRYSRIYTQLSELVLKSKSQSARMATIVAVLHHKMEYFFWTGFYLIEDGKITRPVKGATLIGNGPDVLTKVSMVGTDLALDSGVGTCGKEGQSVPVGVGQPTLKIDGLTVGGTSV